MEKIQRTTIWLSPNIMNSLDDMKSKANCKSRSEFIEQTIKFYSEYNDSMNKEQYLPLSISSAMNGMIKVSEDRISKRLFKNTVVKVKGSYFLFPLIISRSSVTTIDRIINTNESISKSLMYTTSV